jgi:hypothetical protein
VLYMEMVMITLSVDGVACANNATPVSFICAESRLEL